MANRIEYIPVEITIAIPDAVINDTIIKRKARLFTLIYNQKSLTLTLTWIVSYFANIAGEYGEPLDYIFDSFAQQTIADNNTFVDPQTGNILLPDATGEYSMNYMGQYDWFNMLAEAQPMEVHNMVRAYGAAVPEWSKK